MGKVIPARRYWHNRFKYLEKASHGYGIKAYMEIEPAFLQAQREIQMQIDSWYARFAANNNVTLAEAKKMLSSRELSELRWDVNEYIKYGRQTGMIDTRWMQQLENASAKFHISRLEALQIRTQQALEVAFGNELDAVDKMARKVFSENYYHSIFEVQKGFNIGWEVGQIDSRKLNNIIKKPWATDGQNFSSRIWTRKQQMVGDLHQELTRTLVQGKAPDEAIRHMEKFVDSKVKNARNAASRLVMTEQAYFHSISQEEAFRDLDVERFEIIATLDSRTSEICQDMDGRHFAMVDYEPGGTAPPFHPNCRSVTAPYFEDNYGGERAARGADGKTYYVPDNMKYKDWKDSMVDGNTEGLKPAVPDSTVKSTPKQSVQKLDKLQKSGMDDSEYNEYLSIINGNQNPNIINLYNQHGDGISKITKGKRGRYMPGSNTMVFDYPQYDGMNKYGTLAHEYAHYFDAQVQYDGLHFTEIKEVQNATGLKVVFSEVASSSDEFLEAIRKDREHIKTMLTDEAKADLLAHHASHGVQDAIDGLFTKSRLRWGHGEKYYNRKYNDLVFLDKIGNSTRKKDLQQVYKNLGFDASNQTKVKMICRQYEAASEIWAHVMSAETCGGESLEYVKKWLPNSYSTLLKILEGVK